MFAAVAFGAFGAHGLKDHLTPDRMAIYETGVRYHAWHALGLFAVAWIRSIRPSPAVEAAGRLMVAGVFLFSGSLYLLAITGARAWGAITPLGGLCFLGAWAAMFVAGRTQNRT
jgi:uncharacterized membrane protein YgdD (TMEM256/DUF423 family)